MGVHLLDSDTNVASGKELVGILDDHSLTKIGKGFAQPSPMVLPVFTYHKPNSLLILTQPVAGEMKSY